MLIEFMVPPDEARQLRMIKQLNGRLLQRLTVSGVGYVSLGVLFAFALVILEAGPLFLIPVLFLVVGLWLLSYRLRLPRKLMRRAMPLLNQILTFRIDDEGITQRGAMSATTFYWAGITEVGETGEFWFVRVGKMHAVTLPRQFIPPADAALLRAVFVDRHLLPA